MYICQVPLSFGVANIKNTSREPGEGDSGGEVLNGCPVRDTMFIIPQNHRRFAPDCKKQKAKKQRPERTETRDSKNLWGQN